MRRLLVALALVVLAAPAAAAQSSDWSGGWTDPVPSSSRDGKPLTYLEEPKALTGEVSHPNGVSGIDALIIPDPDHPPAAGCDPTIDSVTAEQSGTSATYHVNATFPCNILYELKATAHANAGSGITGSTPDPYYLPLFVAVLIPPAPVDQVDAILEVNGDKRKVTLQWRAGSEPDLLGYVVTRTSSGTTETLGQVNAGDDTSMVDGDPPAGKTNRYDVTAVRRGPDDGHKQVASSPTSVKVVVPARTASADDGTNGEPPLTTIVNGEPSQGRPDPRLLSSVNARGVPPSPPTTLDTGFNETLSYPTPAEEAAAPRTTGDPAVVATFEETSESPFSNKQTMTFVAAGLAMLVGALVISHVTRRAALDEY